LEFTVEKLVYGGDGLARMPADEHGTGKTVFIPFVVTGERVDATIIQEKPGFARARINSMLEPSRHRVEPNCPYFTRCGGCQYQHMPYEHQLETKAAILKESLRRIAKLDLPVDLSIHASPPWNYRNRTRLLVQATPAFAVGYSEFGSHTFLPIEECPISSSLINQAIRAVSEAGRGGGIDGSIREIEFFANAEDSQLLLEVYIQAETGNRKQSGSPMQPRDGVKPESTPSWVENLLRAIPGAIGVTVFPQSIPGTAPQEDMAFAGSREMMYQAAHAKYRVSAGSFFQVNRHLIDELVEIVTQGRLGDTALDLYAGVGLFSAVLSREFKQVIAVDASQKSGADLAYNVPADVKAVTATVESYLQKVRGKLRPDFVVVDPPRNGLGARVATQVAELRAPALAYVSCDPATLARDLVPLLAAGYHVEQAHLVDLFPQTFHLESIMQLTL
jgi:23S rRNA (uracil1939-C5)-methyltransferase